MNQWSWFEFVKKTSKIKIEYNSYNISYDIKYAMTASISIPPTMCETEPPPLLCSYKLTVTETNKKKKKKKEKKGKT